ncbi:PAS domain S-box protein [Methanospirillum stamsii]|uniref:Histidine kinase n=1 Tax=Methanospirillum stamsii TaxID=1277351 RepID=A0A2V2N5Z8_9EURY|nr:PAS domain S-box protein [Methanospirillum stamsii]PWR75514.1 histidine kinase [Methanospirillum stamsii]
MGGEDQALYNLIQKSLKLSPRGLTITEISKKIKKDRNITAKHLDILKAEGKVDTRQVGSARVYWLSERIPLSAFLCFTRNIILILDKDLNIVQVNNQYLSISGFSKEELIGRSILENGLPLISSQKAISIISSSGNEQVISEISYFKDNYEYVYKIEVIPTHFEDGEKGLTIVLEDISEKKKHLKNMEFLARTAMELVELNPDADIYQYIAECVCELLPEKSKRCWVISLDQVTGQLLIRAVFGEAFRKASAYLAGGRDLVGLAVPLQECFSEKSYFEGPLSIRAMRELKHRPLFEDEEFSFYDICAHLFPRDVCEKFLVTNHIGKTYLTGLVWQEQIFGVVGICMGPDEDLESWQVIESFLRQASIAIARRMTEQRLSQSEQDYHNLINEAELPVLTMDNHGRITHVNRKYTDDFGYSLTDIPTRDIWLKQTFPGIQDQHRILETLKSASDSTIKSESILISLTSKNNVRAEVCIQPVLVSDGMLLFFMKP